MNKEELENKVKGLEGLVEAQRLTINDLSIKLSMAQAEISKRIVDEQERKESKDYLIEINDELLTIRLNNSEAETIQRMFRRIQEKNQWDCIKFSKIDELA